MIYLKYREQEIDQNTYALEYLEDEKLIVEYFSDHYAYARALIKAYDNKISGYVVYCLTRNRQKILNGLPVKRGAKAKSIEKRKIENHFTPQLPAAPVTMK